MIRIPHMVRSIAFPPVDVFFDDGERYWARTNETRGFGLQADKMRTSGGQEGSFRDGAERPQSAMVFRHAGGGVPDVVTGQVDVLPPQR
jgi:hypothetical protein